MTQPCLLQSIKGVLFPADIRYRQILVTGPPGVGKSTLITRIGGWSEEGYLDLSLKPWWTSQALTLRPREIHLGFPFLGFAKALAVFDQEWLACSPPPRLACERIRLPPRKRFFFNPDWYRRYVFEFLLPPADLVFRWRSERARRGTHPVDAHLTQALVQNQIAVYRQVAGYLHHQGFYVYIRAGTEAPPLCFPTAAPDAIHREQAHHPLDA